jgi:hypothetical protein
MCAAVDFAVIARIIEPSGEARPAHERLSTLVLFGIRGLGTWGAAWYIDRCFEDLSEHLAASKDYHALLKVTYWNQRIRVVEDVSDKPQGFFDSEMLPETIQATIKEWQSS